MVHPTDIYATRTALLAWLKKETVWISFEVLVNATYCQEVCIS